MGIALIKKVNEKTPYWVKAPFARIIRRQLIGNKVFIETMDMLNAADDYSKEQINNTQIKKLKETLIHAYEHSSYYRRVFNDVGFDPYNIETTDCLLSLPILDKSTFIEHFEEIQTDDINDYYLVTTGGTSGEPTKINMEKNAIYREWAFIYHFWSRYGYDYKNSRLATFRGVDMGSRLSEINPLYSEIRLNPFILNLENVEQYISSIRQYKADFIYGYPSAVYNFCRLAKIKGIDLSGLFKAALMISENLYDFQENLITNVLRCPVVIFYGHSERAAFAERSDKGYLFNPLYGVTEINEKGEPIVTGFINSKTPLIRYAVDDYVKKNDYGCYDIFGHRDSDIIIGKNGEQIRASLLNFHGGLFEKYGQIQIVQYKEGELIIRIPEKSDRKNEEIEDLRKRMDSALSGKFDISIERTDNIELTSRGKYKFLVQRLNHNVENEYD